MCQKWLHDGLFGPWLYLRTVQRQLAPERVRVWVLDQSGNRREAVPVTTADGAKGDTVFHIGPQHRTLWYEIEIQD